MTEHESATSELLDALSKDVAALLREEVTRLRAELHASLEQSRRATLLLGGAAVLGGMAGGAATAGAVRLIDLLLPRPVSALLVAGLLGAGAGALTRRGLAELERARQLLPTGGS